MSSAKLVDWIDRLLFGSGEPLGKTPEPLGMTVQELESRGVRVRDTALHGGLVSARSLLEADLDTLLDHRRDGEVGHPVFRTRAAASFYNRLLCLRGGGETTDVPPEPGNRADGDILDSILRGEDDGCDDPPFVDARYWGRLARQMLHHRRPPPLLPLRVVPDNGLADDLRRLYDVTCRRLGRAVSPFRLVLVPRDDHVDPVHWASVDHLRAFVAARPTHRIAVVVRSLLDDYVLHARADVTLMSPGLCAFLGNVLVVHDAVRDVRGTNVPPRLVDVFQRLLALAGKDCLWGGGGAWDGGPDTTPRGATLLAHERVLQLENQVAGLADMLEEETSSRRRTTCAEQRHKGCM